MEKKIKTIRETCKYDNGHGIIEVYNDFSEYDINGKLISYKKTSTGYLYRDEVTDDFVIEFYDDTFEENYTYKCDKQGRLVEKHVFDNEGFRVVEKYTYDDEGRELSLNRIGNTGEELSLNFFYETDSKGRRWKRCSRKGQGDEKFDYQVLDKDGKILFKVEMTFDIDNDDITYNYTVNRYDENDRIVDAYSFNNLGNGQYTHTDYREENGEKITQITERILTPPNDDVEVEDLIDNPEIWEVEKNDELLLKKETIIEKDLGHSIEKTTKDELTGIIKVSTDYHNTDGDIVKSTIIETNREGKGESSTIYLYDEKGNVVDGKIFDINGKEELIIHDVNCFSGDNVRLFSSHSEKTCYGDYDVVLYHYDYTFFD